MTRYRIVIEGEGKVFVGDSGEEARRKFRQFVELSKKRPSKGAPRSVTLFKDYQIVSEYPSPAR